MIVTQRVSLFAQLTSEKVEVQDRPVKIYKKKAASCLDSSDRDLKPSVTARSTTTTSERVTLSSLVLDRVVAPGKRFQIGQQVYLLTVQWPAL